MESHWATISTVTALTPTSPRPSLPMGGRGLGEHRHPSVLHHSPARNALLTKHRSRDRWLPEPQRDRGTEQPEPGR